MATPSPVGLATKAGLSGAVGFAVATIIAATQEATPLSIATAVGAVLSLLTVLGGRYAQAVATIRSGVDELDAYLDDPAGPSEVPVAIAAAPTQSNVDHSRLAG